MDTYKGPTALWNVLTTIQGVSTENLQGTYKVSYNLHLKILNNPVDTLLGLL